METTMQLALEAYAELTGRSPKELMQEVQTDKTMQATLMQLMFCVAEC